ncbi:MULTISPECIES: carbohydrate ABC transporter permease [Paenibacillus]|jgi:sn-glycerol 3-phosphate transport system permease protein|uniref:Sugar ABC transporter permease n=1 Tax=Paenibacillus taichungensis TaxID=484184 RepID=A0ABX2MNJ2_9BACL|nr:MULTISPECIES: sugar ABC transporter permease [Paenibacillus]OME82805.1 ABC transporter permease [Paenibacillus pabuli]MDR9746314.1 sugar ABC transporter permease [Paenibacillus taichungensis]NEU61666.1 sugar ABC transporter permease [Paenibacillus sp. ALJ109b]NUU55604.1 sugar ABC transporter permease [Paenibacillus taichungensis]PIH58752.1 sugar ABC transporter permease [Paenibacillus sp. LK1]
MTVWSKLRPYVLVAPSITIFSIFFLYPIFYMIFLSFYNWDFINPVKEFVGFNNFVELFKDSAFLQVLSNSLNYTLLSVSLSIVISLLLAIWLNREGAWYGFVQGALFSPHIVSLVSVSLVWMWLMDPKFGLLNGLLDMVGLPKLAWLSSPDSSLLSLVLVSVWKGVGYNALIFIAGLQSIPRDVYEASALDEANWWRKFYKITLPMLSPTLFFLIIINLISSFQVFETIAIMTNGGPINSTNTLVFYIYEYGFRYFKIGYASAAGVILLVVVGLLTLVYFKLLSRKVHYQ